MSLDYQQIAQSHQQAIDSVFAQRTQIEAIADLMIERLKAGSKVMWCGNGGSAAEAQHMAAELMVRYVKNRQALASIALTNDSSILTAHPNDFDFDTVFARQVQGLGQKGDLLIGMSTSGKSANILNAFKAAQAQGVNTIALVGQDSSAVASLADYIIQIDSQTTARIQEAHTLTNHLICELLDLAFD